MFEVLLFNEFCFLWIIKVSTFEAATSCRSWGKQSLFILIKLRIETQIQFNKNMLFSFFSVSFSLYGAVGLFWVQTIDSSLLVIPATALPSRRLDAALDHLTLQQSPLEHTCPGTAY